MENIENLHWKWNEVFTPLNDLHNDQLKIIYVYLKRKSGLIYNVNAPIWRKHIKSLILSNELMYGLKGGRELMSNLNKTKRYESRRSNKR